MNDQRTQQSDSPWKIEVFFDGDCPLCRREINLLKWFDRKQRIKATDIATEDFQAEHYGKSMSEFMDEIQGRKPDGSWVIGVEVFRQLYSAIGLGFAVWFTRWPGISHLLEFGYRVFAKNRLKLTGRCTTDTCDLPNPK
ncbi:MAG: DUF393 domain-containing protein [Fuerstiella sp.]